jgi:hypothetical protein
VLAAETASHQVYETDPMQDPRWEELARKHPRASVFHCSSWLKALRRTYDYEPFVVTTCSPDTELTNGLLFCRVRSWLTGGRLVSLPFSDHCEPLVDSADELTCLLMEMQHRVDQNTWKYVEIRPTLFEPGIETGMGKAAAYFFHRLKLEEKSSVELFHGFHKNCIQRKIRRAEREGLQYEEGRSEEILKKFYHLLLLTRRRQGLPPQPLAWFRSLAEGFGNSLKIRVASKNQVPVSSILTISFGRTMTYKYGCSDENLNKYGGMAFLMWKAIEDAKNSGLDEVDLGRSDINNEGLAVFKDRLGATRSVMQYWRFPKSDSAGEAGWKTRFARQLVSVAPDSSLAAAGNLLYRHFG